ncbi:hypothetical protein LZ641_05430, partial [Hafnia paralvei]|nr:hypothetical protein [Hafnia paralvei]
CLFVGCARLPPQCHLNYLRYNREIKLRLLPGVISGKERTLSAVFSYVRAQIEILQPKVEHHHLTKV